MHVLGLVVGLKRMRFKKVSRQLRIAWECHSAYTALLLLMVLCGLKVLLSEGAEQSELRQQKVGSWNEHDALISHREDLVCLTIQNSNAVHLTCSSGPRA